MYIKRIILFMCLFGLTAVVPKTARACGGGIDFGFTTLFKESDILIKARIIEVDDAGQNVVVRVERYFKGGPGPEYVIIQQQYSPGAEETLGLYQGFLGHGDCQILREVLYRGYSLYFLAAKTLTGAYVANAQFRFNSETPTVSFFMKDGVYENKEYTERQFIAVIAAQGGQVPVAPKTTALYPLYAPLLLTTSKGTHYMLPIDGGKPVDTAATVAAFGEDAYQSDLSSFLAGPGKERCIGEHCTAYSSLGYIGGWELHFCDKPYSAALISPGYPFVVWVDQQIVLNCQKPIITLNTDDQVTAQVSAEHAQWSPDSRMLAYSDLKGLWLWVRDQPENNPRLLIPAGKTFPYARYFSPRGDYLAVTDGAARYTLNLQTGKTFYDGLFSPTEEFFLAFGPTDEKTGQFPVKFCLNSDTSYVYLGCLTHDFGDPAKAKDTDPSLQPDTEDTKHVLKIAWVGDYAAMGLAYPNCDCTDNDVWDASKGYLLREWTADSSFFDGPTYPSYRSIIEYATSPTAPLRFTSAFDFAYDRTNQTLAVLKNGTTIVINKHEYTIKDVDSPITKIDWLPTMMYRERH